MSSYRRAFSIATAACDASRVSSSRCLVENAFELRAFEIEDADAPILEEQRDHELGADIADGIDVARILRHIGNEHRLFVERRVAHQPLAQLDR